MHTINQIVLYYYTIIITILKLFLLQKFSVKGHINLSFFFYKFNGKTMLT